MSIVDGNVGGRSLVEGGNNRGEIPCSGKGFGWGTQQGASMPSLNRFGQFCIADFIARF